MLLFDANALKNPTAHTSHLGCAVAEPTVCVYLPGGHLVWARQESAWMLLLDVETLKNPGAHASHVGSAVIVPAVLVYFPGGHVV